MGALRCGQCPGGRPARRAVNGYTVSHLFPKLETALSSAAPRCPPPPPLLIRASLTRVPLGWRTLPKCTVLVPYWSDRGMMPQGRAVQDWQHGSWQEQSTRKM